MGLDARTGLKAIAVLAVALLSLAGAKKK